MDPEKLTKLAMREIILITNLTDIHKLILPASLKQDLRALAMESAIRQKTTAIDTLVRQSEELSNMCIQKLEALEANSTFIYIYSQLF